MIRLERRSLRHSLPCAWLLLAALSTAVSAQEQLAANPATEAKPGRPINFGMPVPDLVFKDIRALSRNLSELGEHDAWVLVFTTTQCPLVRQTLPKIAAIQEEFRDADIQFLAVNVGAGDTLRTMAGQAVDLQITFPFVKDFDLSCVRTLGVTRTPEVVVLDRDRRLRYRGRVDDQLRLGGARPAPTRRDLCEALTDVLNGRPVSRPETSVDGCLISEGSADRPPQPLPVYYGDIDEIVYRRCSECHHPKSSAPFPLLTFDDLSSHAQMVAEVVRDGTMPPWYAHPDHGRFQNDPTLTANERRRLIHWVQSGCPEGDPAQAAAVPEFQHGTWRIGEPDLVITMIEEHTIPATGFVPYRYTILPYIFTEDTWVEAFEIRPENKAVVHHCNMAYVTAGGAGLETFITGYVPGGQAMDLGRFDVGVARRIPRGAVLALQIHYTTIGVESACRVQVGLRYPKKPVRKEFHHILLDPRGWRIPPHAPAFRLHAGQQLDDDVMLLGLFTHMHLRGRDMTFTATAPDGSRETLLQIPNYNFEWQLGYEIPPGDRRLKAGTRLEATGHFDNSSFNPYNPDSGSEVRYGPQSTDEMFNAFAFFVKEHEQLNIDVDPRTGRIRKPTSSQ